MCRKLCWHRAMQWKRYHYHVHIQVTKVELSWWNWTLRHHIMHCYTDDINKLTFQLSPECSLTRFWTSFSQQVLVESYHPLTYWCNLDSFCGGFCCQVSYLPLGPSISFYWCTLVQSNQILLLSHTINIFWVSVWFTILSPIKFSSFPKYWTAEYHCCCCWTSLDIFSVTGLRLMLAIVRTCWCNPDPFWHSSNLRLPGESCSPPYLVFYWCNVCPVQLTMVLLELTDLINKFLWVSVSLYICSVFHFVISSSCGKRWENTITSHFTKPFPLTSLL